MNVMMRAVPMPTNHHSRIRRMVMLVAIVSFAAAYFAVPLYAAMSICDMPCCDHGDQDSEMTLIPPGVSSCEAYCASLEASATAGMSFEVASPQTPVSEVAFETSSGTVGECIVHRPSLQRDCSPAPGKHAPLEVLNSVFRI